LGGRKRTTLSKNWEGGGKKVVSKGIRSACEWRGKGGKNCTAYGSRGGRGGVLGKEKLYLSLKSESMKKEESLLFLIGGKKKGDDIFTQGEIPYLHLFKRRAPRNSREKEKKRLEDCAGHK